MKLTDFLQNIGQPIAYYPRLSKITGGVKETIFLCQLIYWMGKQKDLEGWIYKTQEEIEEETGLSRYEQESARKTLKLKGFLEEKFAGIPRKLFFRVNVEKINQIWEEYYMRENHIQYCGKTTYNIAEKPHYGGEMNFAPTTIDNATIHYNNIAYTENTTEITTEITKKGTPFQKNSNPTPLPFSKPSFSKVTYNEEELSSYRNEKLSSILDRISKKITTNKENRESPPEPAPNKEQPISTQLDTLCEHLYREGIFPEAPTFKNTMLKQGKTKEAILLAFQKCKRYRPKKPWSYCAKIIGIGNGNITEKKHIEMSKKFKEEEKKFLEEKL